MHGDSEHFSVLDGIYEFTHLKPNFIRITNGGGRHMRPGCDAASRAGSAKQQGQVLRFPLVFTGVDTSAPRRPVAVI